MAPDVFLERLIDRLSTPGRSLLAPEQEAEQRESLQRLLGMAVEFVISVPSASTRDLARHLATVVPQPDSEAPSQEAVADPLKAMLGMLREELLGGVARIGGRLSELRMDTDLDISHGVVRYLELLKLSALMQRPEGQSVTEALADVNARLLAAATPLQREILQTSSLDETVLAAEGEEHAPRPPMGFREEHSLGPFLPRKGAGLALSASDIETYRSCPLRYKFARVLRIPTEQTIHQRFGIVVHQVLERFHSDGSSTLEQLLELLDAGWRRGGFGWEGRDGELFEKASTALTRYHGRLHGQDSEPVWFERSFSFRLGPHHLRGRVDRVDRLGEGADALYELIDYKTGRPARSSSSAMTSSSRSMRSRRARTGGWSPPSRPTTTCWTTSRCPFPVASATPTPSGTWCSRSGRGSWPRSSSRSPRPAPARSATTASSARPPRSDSARAISRHARAGAESVEIRVPGCPPRARSRVRSAPRSPLACSRRSTKAWMSGSLCTARPTWRS